MTAQVSLNLCFPELELESVQSDPNVRERAPRESTASGHVVSTLPINVNHILGLKLVMEMGVAGLWLWALHGSPQRLKQGGLKVQTCFFFL